MESGNGILEVQLVDARCIENKELFAKMDPYVLIQYGNQQHKSTVARGQGRNPVWNESFIFNAEYPSKTDERYKISLRVMDRDKFTADDFVGDSTIYVKDVVSLGVEQGKAQLPPRKYRLVLHDNTYAGEIRVGVTFIRKDEEEGNGDIGGWKQSSFS